jgi:hypothetical protein
MEMARHSEENIPAINLDSNIMGGGAGGMRSGVQALRDFIKLVPSSKMGEKK